MCAVERKKSEGGEGRRSGEEGRKLSTKKIRKESRREKKKVRKGKRREKRKKKEGKPTFTIDFHEAEER